MEPQALSILLSSYGAKSREPSPVNRMMSSFASDFREGIDINLGVGYVNENTIPRSLIRKALSEVLAHPKKYRSSLNYGGPQGTARLVDSIASYYVSHRVGGLTRDVISRKRIIVGPDGATSLLEGLAQVVHPGIVVTSDPMYYIYTDFLERAGFTVVTVPERADGLHADDVAARIDELGARVDELGFLYVVTVNNPTATIIANKERTALVRLATDLSRRLGRVVPLVLDKAYEDLIHDPSVERPRSGLLDDELGVVLEVGTLSKIIAPGLRIGYMIAEDGPFLHALVQRTSDVGFSAPPINQEIASWLLDNAIDRQLETVNRGYRDKARSVRRWLDSALGDALEECRGGQASFYYYLTLRGICTGEGSPFFRCLSRTTGNDTVDGPLERRRPRVAYIPGEYCVHPKGSMVEAGKRQLRFSYGYEEMNRLERAIGCIAEAAAYAREAAHARAAALDGTRAAR